MNHLKIPYTHLPIMFWILELISLILVGSAHNSVCVQAREISTKLYIFIIFIYSFIITDLFFMIISYILPQSVNRPFTIIYNLAAGIVCFIGSFVLASGITFCGNKVQIYFIIASGFGIIASILHILIAISIRKILPPSNIFAFSSSQN